MIEQTSLARAGRAAPFAMSCPGGIGLPPLIDRSDE